MSDNTGKMKIKDVAKAVARSSSDSIEQIKLIQGGLGDKLADIRKLESELVSQARAESERAQQRELAELNAREQEPKAPFLDNNPSKNPARAVASEVKVAKAVIRKEEQEAEPEAQPKPAATAQPAEAGQAAQAAPAPAAQASPAADKPADTKPAEKPAAEQAAAAQPVAGQPMAADNKPAAEQPETKQPETAAKHKQAEEPKARPAEAQPAEQAEPKKMDGAEKHMATQPAEVKVEEKKEAAKAESPDKAEKPARTERQGRQDRGPRQERGERQDRPRAAKQERPERAADRQPRPARPEGSKEGPRTTTAFIRPAERIARRGGALRDDAALRNASRPAAPREDRRGDRGDRPQRPQQRRDGQAAGDRPQRPQQQGGNRGGYGDRQQRPGGGGGDRPQRQGSGGAAGGRQRPAAAMQTQSNEKGRVSNYDPNKSNYIRVFDNDKRGKSRKQQDKERRAQLMIADDEVMRGRKPKRKQQQAPKPEPVKIEKAVITTEKVTVKTLSERIGKPASEIIKRLLLLGTIATINNEIDFDTAELVASEMGVELEHKVEQTAEEIVTEDVADADEDMEKRPPVVTIMGHVDHGKTSLLDKIRSARVTAGEAGGITQHIGAYMVEANGQPITFLDTPGHEAFTAMRARGAQVTDVVVLVVAADDGIMPQTVEAINHAKASGVPIIVAVNKIDLPNANVERVKQELTENDLVWEDWGGDTVIVPVSAHTGEGIDQLLEMILLVSEMQELRANPNRKAKGTIVEARLDKGRGPVATVLVQNGTLHVGDTVVAGTATGRIRGMLNDLGENVKDATPSQPVEILGLGEVPEAGDTLYATEAGSLSRAVAEERKNRIKAERVKAMSKVSLDDLFSQISEGNIKELNVIVKADVQGSVEAVKQSLEKLSNEQVRVKVIHGAVGAIANSDILLASTSNAIIIGFNVRPDATARVAAEKEQIDVRLYRVIYDAIEDIEKAMKGLLDPVFEEVILGHAEVRNTFKVSAIGTIAGCYVLDGKINRNNSVRLLRDNVVIYEGRLDSLRRFKDDVREVASGYECGMGLHNFNDIKDGDIIEAFEEQEVEQ